MTRALWEGYCEGDEWSLAFCMHDTWKLLSSILVFPFAE